MPPFTSTASTPYGVLANLAAMPVVSALVMPAGLLGLLAMPFGFDGVFWRDHGRRHRLDDRGDAMGRRACPAPIGRMAAFGIGPLIAASAGIILLGLLRTPLRWSGAAVLVLAAVWALRGAAAGYPDFRRRPQCRRPRQRRTAASDAHRQGRVPAQGMAGGGCRPPRSRRMPRSPRASRAMTAGCVTQAADGGFVALALRPDALADDCERAALVVTARQAPPSCASPVIDRDRLRRQGAMALRRSRDGFVGRCGQASRRRSAVVAGGRRRHRG